MEIRDYLRVLRARWLVVTVAVLVAGGTAAALSLLTTPVYQARTQLFVSTQATATSTDLLQGSNFAQQRVQSYADIVSSPRVLEPVIEELDLGVRAAVLAERVSARVPLDTLLVTITVDDEDPDTAAEIANAVGVSFATTVAELEQPSDGGPSPVRVSPIEEATPPQYPVSPRPLRNVALGLVLGALAGFGLALLRDQLDTSVRGEADVERVTEAPVLGGIAFDPQAPIRPLIVHTDPHGRRSEAFRQLRTNLQFLDVTNHPRSIVVTSSIPNEGKTTTAINLAITMSQTGSRVALVEGDLRRPKMATYLQVEGAVGLTTVLIGQAKLKDVLQPWGDHELFVLAAGRIPPNPSEVLGSQAMRDLVQRLEDEYDIVIVDGPPLLPVTDAAVLATITGGAIVVAASKRVNRDQLARSLQNLDAVGARVLGIVLNMLPTKGPDAYEYYSYEYTAAKTRPPRQAEGSGRRRRSGTKATEPTAVHGPS